MQTLAAKSTELQHRQAELKGLRSRLTLRHP